MLALLAATLIGVVAWFVWPTTPPAITAAKANYARLQLGMSENEMTAILGGPPQVSQQMYGHWMDDRKLYLMTDPQGSANHMPLTIDPQGFANLGPLTKLYDYRVWTFGDEDHSGWSYHGLAVQGVFDQGRLVGLRFVEGQNNAAKKWLRELGNRLDINPSFLNAIVDEDHKAMPPP